MGATKFQLVDFEEEDYRIFAVHTALPGFRLAFLFNQICDTYFVLQSNGFEIEKETSLPYYYFYDEERFAHWKLIENKFETLKKSGFSNLFSDEQTTETKYLLPEFQKANFIVKIEGDCTDKTPDIWMSYVKKIAHIQSAYEIPITKVKKNSKKNLIF